MSGIFKGLKVLDFTWVIVGPMTIRYLSDQGATVVKVESANHPGPLRQSPPYKDGKSGINSSAYFAAQNTNKMSFGVNLSRPEGLEITKKLIKWADVVAESFAPGVMENLGLSYEEMKKINPNIIFIRMNMLGAAGPRTSARGYGFQLVAYSGFTYITGWPDRVPAQPFGPYTDWVAPRFAASALLMALIHRQRTGEGAYIDLSQHEAGIQFLIPILLERQLNGRNRERAGNLHPYYCPHGVYPCKGKERWVAISITNDEQWKAFSGITDEHWIDNKEFASSLGRKQNEETLDSLVSRWTRERPPEEIVSMLQEQGIPAGVVQNSRDLVNDPQLAHRQAIWYLEHETVGKHAVFGQGFILSKNPPPPPKAAPRLGEHTYHICKEILEMPDEEIATLLGDGILQIVV
jgi:benzylsuccinate CoA-transferase BbsF subunit